MKPVHIFTLVLFLTAACADSSRGSENNVERKRILAVFTLAGKSHVIFFTPLLQGLAKRGHDVTVYTMFPTGAKIDNYHEHQIKLEWGEKGPINFFKMGGGSSLSSYFDILNLLITMSEKMCRNALSSPDMQQLIESNEKYDLFITSLFFNDCALPLAHKFNIPVVEMFSSNGMNYIFELYGNPMEIATVQDSGLVMQRPMSIYDRIINTFLTVYMKFQLNWNYYPLQNALVREYFGPETPSVQEIQKERGSLLLVNTNLATNSPRSLAPNVKAIGGIQLSQPKPLHQELQKWMDDSPAGVIYFSLGSTANPGHMPPETLDAIFQTFGRLEQRVLFKWTTDKVPETFPNIRITQWAPQGDLLSHPNLKVFVSHGGGLSSQEAIYHGVPLLGLPIAADQKVNAHNAANKGMALVIEYENLTESSFGWAINQLLHNPSYKEKALHLSRLYHDQPIKPLEEAIFWTEYVMRHDGAKHLRSDAIHLAWWQRELLDVFAVVLAALVVIVAVAYHLLKTIWGIIRPKTKYAIRVKTD